jgi:hypothetical protein
MQSSLIAVVLCLFANAADAQCLRSAPSAADPGQAMDMIRVSTMTVPAHPVSRTGGDLITAAAASTRHEPGTAREGAVIVRASPAKAEEEGEESPRRGGTAMLLAALALMSGIALRRYGSNGQ